MIGMLLLIIGILLMAWGGQVGTIRRQQSEIDMLRGRGKR